jgi:hypothetical protein
MPLEWFPKAFLLSDYFPSLCRHLSIKFFACTSPLISKPDCTEILFDAEFSEVSTYNCKKIEGKAGLSYPINTGFAFQICTHFLTLIFNPQ